MATTHPALEPQSVPPPAGRRIGFLVLGVAMSILATLFLLPLLMSVVVEQGVALPLRLLNAALLGVPAGLLLVAGIQVLRIGLGRQVQVPVLPTSAPGRWSVGLILAAFGLFALAHLGAVISRPQQAESFFDAPWVAIPLLATWSCAAAAFVAGVAAAGFRHERSLVVLAAIAVGFMATAFGVGEVLVPH